jgi:SAM-dependent methyltransferase
MMSSATSIALPSRFGSAAVLKLGHVEFREGIAENLPVEDEWADVVISNGVINLCADKRATFSEIFRVFFRVSVGARTLRSIAGVGSRSRQPAGRGARCNRWPTFAPGGTDSYPNDTYRVHHERRYSK